MSMIQNNAQAGAAFFGAAFSTASSQIQQSQPSQVNQLQGLFQQMFSSFFQAAAGGMQQAGGGGFAQNVGTTPGFVPAPGPENMQPSNPVINNPSQGGQIAGQGGFFVGGFVAVGGQQTQPPQGGIEKLGPNKFKTPGGFTIEAEGKSQAWKITTPEGKTTRIWGDPHVHEGDGGKWDFKKDMSFCLPDGTKIECKTVPYGNGATVTGEINIMNGNQRANISGIDKNKPTSGEITNDRYAFDAKTNDGVHAYLGKGGDDWFVRGKGEIVGGNMRTGTLTTKNATTGKNETFNPDDIAKQSQDPRFGGEQHNQQIQQQMQQMLTKMIFSMFAQMMSGFKPW